MRDTDKRRGLTHICVTHKLRLFFSQILPAMHQVIATVGHMGHVLAAGRRRAGLTQAQAAARLGISQSRVSTLERDARALTLDQMLAMFGVYGLQLLVQDRPEAGLLELREPDGANW